MLAEPSARRRHRALVLGILAVLALTAACAMPSDAEPQPISMSDDFDDLLEPAPPPTTATPAEETLPRTLWFIADDVLSSQSTQVEVSRAGDLTEVLNRLAAGTRQQDHRSAIPDGVVFVGHRSDEGSRTVTIELADVSLFEIDGNELARAVAQIVFTTTHPGNNFGYDRVRFEIDGSIRSVPIGAGSNTNDPVGRCDYERFDPSPSCPATTTTTTTAASP
jgi:hypothetical protein